jgi:hypothetical protein
LDKPKPKTEKQLAYLDSIIPWSWFIENQTQIKAIEFKGLVGAYGLSSVLFTCEALISTDWGSHPLAQEKYKGKEANNLTLMEATKYWDGRKIKFNGQEYKAFDNWEDFCIHYSDWIVFSGLYQDLLVTTSINEQMKMYALIKGREECYTEFIELLTLLGIKHDI